MINFFRKIRYDLMEKNKTGKYIKYAIGEIVLVMIGILLALSINNWNEERKVRNIESSYLTRLKNDLEAELNYIGQRISRTENDNDNLNLFLEKVYTTQENIQAVGDLFTHLHLNTDPLASANSTYRELIGTGDFDVFQNDQLKKSIIDYYRVSEDLALQIDEFNSVSTDIMVETFATIPNFSKLMISNNIPTIFTDHEWSFINDQSSFKFQRLEGMVYIYSIRNNEDLEHLNRLRNMTKKLFEKIEMEIKKNTTQ